MTSAIELENLCVTFKGPRGLVQALRDVSLTVAPGEVCGFLGLNGAGKTTTMHVLLGFITATSGSASLFGTDIRTAIARERIGYLPDNPDTYRFLTGRELLVMTGRLFLMKRATLSERIGEAAAITGLNETLLQRTIAGYSRGQRQRLCLAQALINNPDLLILDEPTSGLDPLGRMEIRALIHRLKTEGKTVFFSSHELSEVESVCDHIAILSEGRLVAQGAVDTLVKPGESMEQYFLRKVKQ